MICILIKKRDFFIVQKLEIFKSSKTFFKKDVILFLKNRFPPPYLRNLIFFLGYFRISQKGLNWIVLDIILYTYYHVLLLI